MLLPAEMLVWDRIKSGFHCGLGDKDRELWESVPFWSVSYLEGVYCHYKNFLVQFRTVKGRILLWQEKEENYFIALEICMPRPTWLLNKEFIFFSDYLHLTNIKAGLVVVFAEASVSVQMSLWNFSCLWIKQGKKFCLEQDILSPKIFPRPWL